MTDQKTQLAIINEGVRKWQKSAGLSSKEAIGDLIVQAHYEHGFDITTGITFQMTGNDEYHRMHINSQKIFRWLDGVTKETNLLNVNFVPSILVNMPADIKQETVSALLKSIDYTGQPASAAAKPLDPLDMLKDLVAQTASVKTSYLNLMDGIDPGEIEDALNQTELAIDQLIKAKASLTALQKKG